MQLEKFQALKIIIVFVISVVTVSLFSNLE